MHPATAELPCFLLCVVDAQLNGGYDFPGSNSGIDMFALTGWIPEQFHTKDEASDFDTKRLWERMLSASKYGDCLMTV